MASCTKPLPDLRESYEPKEANPFGAYVTYQTLTNIFNDYRILNFDQPFDSLNKYVKGSDSKGYSLYFLITKSLLLNDADSEGLINFVSSGNDVFLSADYIDEKLIKKLHITIDKNGEAAAMSNNYMKDTWVSMDYGVKIKGEQYGYFYFPFLNYFLAYPADFARVLGVNEKDQPNYILFFIGKGRLYLHLAPKAFSNYFLLTAKNINYLQDVFSYLRSSPDRIFYDDYYNHLSSRRQSSKKEVFSSMQVILSEPQLRWAFYLILAILCLFIFNNIKRKQRPIPVYTSPKNATVDFVDSITMLYLQNKNNKQVAEKMIGYFYQTLKSKYFIDMPVSDERFITQLLEKSKDDEVEMNSLWNIIQRIQSENVVSDDELIELNRQIEKYNLDKR